MTPHALAEHCHLPDSAFSSLTRAQLGRAAARRLAPRWPPTRKETSMNSLLEPDLSNCALITIDTQCDTLDGQPLEIPGTSAALPNMVRLLNAFRASGRPIVHIVRIYKRDGSNVDLCRREQVQNGEQMLLEGDAGCELAQVLFTGQNVRLDSGRLLEGKPQELSPYEVILYKPRWGAFFKTPLEAHLEGLRVNTVVFCGCNYPNCPRTSIYEASERDFRIALAEDAISGLYPRGKEEMNNIGVWVADTATILKAFNTANPTTRSSGR
jgi:nicotinamidase-related amidase